MSLYGGCPNKRAGFCGDRVVRRVSECNRNIDIEYTLNIIYASEA